MSNGGQAVLVCRFFLAWIPECKPANFSNSRRVGFQIVPGMLECEGLFYCLTECIAGSAALEMFKYALDMWSHWESLIIGEGVVVARGQSLNLTLEFRKLGLRGWSGAGEQIFQHRANMHKTGDLTRKLDTERGEAGTWRYRNVIRRASCPGM